MQALTNYSQLQIPPSAKLDFRDAEERLRLGEEIPKQDQTETMFEALERLKELDSLRIELPTILVDEFDPCEMCGS